MLVSSERRLATLEKIAAITPIEGADNIEIAKVREWEVVVRKGEFLVGDFVVYFEIDTALPLATEHYTFLEARSSRLMDGEWYHILKTVRLRGVYSQGLVLSATEFSQEINEWAKRRGAYPVEGDDLTEPLDLKKWEPDPPNSGGEPAGNFPLKYVMKTDSERVQNLARAWDEIKQKHWIPTEKVDGCLARNTPINMADGTTKMIKDVRVGDYVLGVGDNNILGPTRVLGVKSEANDKPWLAVVGERIGRGRGHHSFSIKATPNHQFFTKAGYVPAEELESGDEVLCLHYDITPTLVQRSLLVGSLLGDGSLSSHGNLIYGHSSKQLDYHQWLNAAMGPIVRGEQTAQSGYGSTMHTTVTAVTHGLDWSGWDKPNGVVPYSVVGWMNPLVMAIWYMDDGTLGDQEGQENSAVFSTHALTTESLDNLQEAFARFNMASRIHPTTKGPVLVLLAEDADLFFSMICPYIPPSMQYKLPEYYRGNPGWVPPRTDGYRPLLDWVTVDSVTPREVASKKFDIETESHNFFASGILVHNSSCTIVNTGSLVEDEVGSYYKSEYTVCSRNWQVREGDNLYWKTARDYGLMEPLGAGESVQFEIAGPGIQKNRLGLEKVRPFVFGYFIGGKAVPRDRWPGQYIVYSAPVYNLTLPDTIAGVIEQADGIKSLINPAKYAEGIVWHTSDGSIVTKLGRPNWKAISNKYLLKGE